VFLITPSPVHAGLDVAIDRFQDSVEALLHQKNSARTPNDGLRLGCIMLDPAFRESVAGILTKKKNRKKSDIPGDPTTHFFEHILAECFAKEDYVVPLPAAQYYDEFPEGEKTKWEPNSPSIFEYQRNGEWLRATWDDYIKPKYKKALDKWNKDTGGGDGSPVSFINFCGGDRWLVWLFCKDYESNFLLASSAGGRMPAHLQAEAGFPEDMSSMGGSENSPAGTKCAIEEELKAAKKPRTETKTMMEKVVGYIDSKKQEKSSQSDKYIRQVADYSHMMVDQSVLETKSPASKDLYVDTLKKKRKAVLQKLHEEEPSSV
jgi:hypothetical protein